HPCERRDVARRDRRRAALRAAREVRPSRRARGGAPAHPRGRARLAFGARGRGPGHRAARVPHQALARGAAHSRAPRGRPRSRRRRRARRRDDVARAIEGSPARMKTLMQSAVPGATLFRRGKVRDVYEAGGDRLVIVASDRLSAFDVVLPTPIPDKGRVLTEISSFWFDRTERVVPNHLVSTNIDDLPAVFREVPELDGRAVLVKRCERIDVECVARGYLAAPA